MASVKSIMNCIGVDTGGSVSVLFHLFGFFRGRVPADPCTGTTAQVSMLDHLNSLQGKHIHLNVIRVGIDDWTEAEIDKLDFSVFSARQIYRTRSLGVGRVQHWDVSSSDADGKDDISSEDEAEDLTHDWTVDNNAIDVFIVSNISADFIGLSPVGGSCDKDDKDMNGVLGGEINRSTEGIARTFAHEIGHYLGLPHNHGGDPDCPDTTTGCNNLMAQTRCATSCGDGICAALLLTSSQGNTIRGHCFVQDGC